MKTAIIEKEQIPNLHFTNYNISSNTKDQNHQMIKQLEKATALGNLYHEKVKVLFQSDEGIKEVRTTIWATTSKYIVLKKGVFIPIRQIIKISF